jgi:hypothetical protein
VLAASVVSAVSGEAIALSDRGNRRSLRFKRSFHIAGASNKKRAQKKKKGGSHVRAPTLGRIAVCGLLMAVAVMAVAVMAAAVVAAAVVAAAVMAATVMAATVMATTAAAAGAVPAARGDALFEANDLETLSHDKNPLQR